MALSDPRPTVMMFHGCGSDPDKFQLESGMDAHVGAFKTYAVWPRGTSRSISASAQATCHSGSGVSCGWNAGDLGTCQTPTSPRPDDVAFTEAILEWMRGNLCVDMDKVYLVGFSNGGQMAYHLNCERAYLFAGIATTGMASGSRGTPGQGSCSPSRALPALSLCGSSDFACSEPTAQTEAWAAATGCTGKTLKTEHLSSTTYCLDATGCPAGTRVQGCAIAGLAHCWPDVPGAGNTNCQNQDPANMDGSLHLLEFFNNL